MVANLRSDHGLSRRAIAISQDGGVTWSNFEHDPQLLDAICQASILSLGTTELAFANCNSTLRENLSVRWSPDNGATWRPPLAVHAGPSAYSCMARLSDGSVGLLYEAGERDPYESIRFVKIPVSRLR